MVRVDTLPDRTDYAGTAYYAMGCDVNPVPLGCLACPLAVCKYDMPLSWRTVEKGRQTRNRVLELARGGLTAAQIAHAAGVSTRTVHRTLQIAREESAA